MVSGFDGINDNFFQDGGAAVGATEAERGHGRPLGGHQGETRGSGHTPYLITRSPNHIMPSSTPIGCHSHDIENRFVQYVTCCSVQYI